MQDKRETAAGRTLRVITFAAAIGAVGGRPGEGQQVGVELAGFTSAAAALGAERERGQKEDGEFHTPTE
jgi:hypothetical protein